MCNCSKGDLPAVFATRDKVRRHLSTHKSSEARPYLDPRSEDNRWRPGTLEKLEKLLGIDESDYEEGFANGLNFDTETVAGRRTWLDTFPPWRPAKDLAKIMRRNRLREFVAVVPDAQRTPMARLMKEAGVHDHVGGDTRLLQVPDSLSRLELDEELKSDCPHPGVCRVEGNPDMSEPHEDCARACLGEPRPTATLSECRPMAYPLKRVRRGCAPSWCVKDHDGDALRCAAVMMVCFITAAEPTDLYTPPEPVAKDWLPSSMRLPSRQKRKQPGRPLRRRPDAGAAASRRVSEE